jgi:hypothetical protein
MKDLSAIQPIPVEYEALGLIIIAGAGIVALSGLAQILFYANIRPSVKPDASVREKLRPGGAALASIGRRSASFTPTFADRDSRSVSIFGSDA